MQLYCAFAKGGGGGFTVRVFNRGGAFDGGVVVLQYALSIEGGAFDGGVVVLQYTFSIEDILCTVRWWFYSMRRCF